MPYCSQCGVELNAETKKCPLCKTTIYSKEEGGDEKAQNDYPPVEVKATMTNGQKRFLSWEIETFFLATSFGIVLTINLLKEGTISWGGYPLIAIGSVWLISTLILLLFKQLILIMTGLVVSLTGALVLIDLMNGKLEWFLVLGLPIVSMTAFVAAVVALLVKYLRNPGANLAAFITFLIGVFCLGLDLLISGYRGKVYISWSAIVMVSLYPLALFFLYYHYRLRKRFDLKKIFHL